MGLIARALCLNPVISMNDNGKSFLFGKTFIQEASLSKIYSHILKTGGGKTVWNYIILHAHNFDCAQRAEEKMMIITRKKAVSIVLVK